MIKSNHITDDIRRKILSLKQTICDVPLLNGNYFSCENWLEMGFLLGKYDIVKNHPRLLRSLSFGDDDYGVSVVEVLVKIVETDLGNVEKIEDYIISIAAKDDNFVLLDKYICTPSVFKKPKEARDKRLIALMMPFETRFDSVCESIKDVCTCNGFVCKRVDDVWEESEIVQDIFSLIYRSEAVICDFTDKNPNVFYEAGIAHTLGRPLIPIVQHKNDIPFDLRHHRYVEYLSNSEGLKVLKDRLSVKLSEFQ